MIEQIEQIFETLLENKVYCLLGSFVVTNGLYIYYANRTLKSFAEEMFNIKTPEKAKERLEGITQTKRSRVYYLFYPAKRGYERALEYLENLAQSSSEEREVGGRRWLKH